MGRATASILLFAALVVLRVQLVRDLGWNAEQAYEGGIFFGWILDAAAVCTVVALATVIALVWHRAWHLTWCVAALVLFVASLANVLYFRYFGMRLDWWIVQLHWRDLSAVKGSAQSLGTTREIVLSVLLGVAAQLVNLWQWRKSTALAPATRDWRRRGLRVVSLAGLALALWFLPTTVNDAITSMVINDQVIRVWLYQNTRDVLYTFSSRKWMDRLASDTQPKSPVATLAQYRDLREPNTVPAATTTTTTLPFSENGSDLEPLDPAWPLLRRFRPDAAVTAQMRRRLGLPERGNLNVIFLFVESLRALELMHEDLGPQVMPRTRAVLDKNAVFFTQAYSSSLSAGQTVRGQFSTQCSMLPNIAGAAVYIAHTTLRIRCIQEQLRSSGYTTLWLNSYDDDFHNSRQFESLHGVEHFYDGEFFAARGVNEKLGVGEWGFADRPFLRESVKALQEVARQGAPFYANVLTISTHHPHTVIDQGALPSALKAATAKTPNYQGYLSRLRYADEAIGDFFADLMRSEMADNTLVVLLGDHSLTLAPHFVMNPRQRSDSFFRIPIALITKNMPQALRLNHPVHQVDIAPTVARIVGAAGEVTWMGRGLFAEQASPFVYRDDKRLHYRTATRACYTRPGKSAPTCYDTRAGDPMFDATLPKVPEDPKQTAFFNLVVDDLLRAIAHNRIAPASHRAEPAPLDRRELKR